MYQDLSNLKRFYILFTLVPFAISIVRTGQLQLYQWDKYFRESEKNRIRDIIIEPLRGLIFDRNGEILVDNRPNYSVSVVPYEFLKADSAIILLSEILNQRPDALKRKINEDKRGNFSPVKINRQIDFKVLSAIEERLLDLPGVFYNTESRRYYPGGIKAPHLFGYLGEITSAELKKFKNANYKQGDSIGKNGIELQDEEYLRGTPGVKYIEVDVLGREVRNLTDLGGQSPDPGRDIFLTIHADIQRYLEDVMADKKGAAVVLDPRNGDVLALMSKPDYDPEIFSNPLTPETWNQLVNHENKPLYNRASQSLFPPGSTYKLVLAAAGLETGDINLEERVLCTGAHRLGNRLFHCWKKTGHGEVNFMAAVEQSCNVYFWEKSRDIGLGKWSEFSQNFQFGKLTKIDLPNESPGLVPTKEYFDQKYGEKKWTRGLVLNLVVGQGDLLTTPLQMAQFAMILGNEGVLFRPHLVKKNQDPLTGEVVFTKVDSIQIQGISKKTYRTIKQGMNLVVNGVKGTAKSARIRGVTVCGKTGTAQNPHGNDHAWFIGFAPMDKPEIAFCIMVENGGSGGAVAAPIAGGVLSIYFKNKNFASRN